MNSLKTLGRLVFIGAITAAICIGLMTVTAMIPREAIQKKSQESAEYFAAKDSFEMIEYLGNTYNTMQDNYSDAILFHIIYHVDPKNPLKTALAAKYYQPDNINIYTDYLEAVTTTPTPEPNIEYSRYWHGPMVYLRPLLLVLNAYQIRILHGILILAGFVVCSIILWRRGLKAEAVILLLSLVLVEGWMLFASLEYATMFLWMTIFCLIALLRMPKVSLDKWGSFFLIAGIVTAFVDFLTTETLTLTMPLLLILLHYRAGLLQQGELGSVAELSQGKAGGTASFAQGNVGKLAYFPQMKKLANNKKAKQSRQDTKQDTKSGKTTSVFLIFFRYVITWGLGYAGMFSIKWLFVYLFMGDSVFKSSFDEGVLRFGGEVYLGNSNLFEQATLRQQLEGSVWHNLAMLYPFANRLSFYTTLLAFGATVLVIFALVYLFHNRIDWGFYGLVALIALIPIARFVLLSNHAYIHFFITYRALLPMVMGSLLLVWEQGVPRKERRR